jgi:hypothetical protein
MGSDFGTVIKNSKLFRVGHDFEDFFRENVELLHAEHALKNFSLRARLKITISRGFFEPVCKFPKSFFKNSLFFWHFSLILKNSI